MDSAGARALRDRIEQRQQWQEAAAVADGNQPRSDPDGDRLESFDGTTRRYHPEQKIEYVDGKRMLVTSRTFKHLIDGSWETEVVVEGAEPAPQLTVVQY